ncbi:uncharacterized protein LOC135369735 [Ornithodoros turicata]|uniref:uncharacterized protein LOC135369735 n=1 Tax=Ornithodoros turicata TaxID=34597 RepID=UPI0031386547
MPVDLYCSSGSPPCTFVRVVAKLLGVELNLKKVNLMAKEHLQPEFVKLNPQHTVPTLDDDGFVLWESRAIGTYLVDKHAAGSKLYPSDLKERAVVNRLLYFESGTLYSAQMNYFRPKWFRGQEPSEEVKAAYNKVLETAVALLGDKKFLTGDDVTLADLGLAVTLGVSIEAVPYPDLEKFPQLVEFYNRVKSAVPEYQEIAAEGLELVKRMAEHHKGGEKGQCPGTCPKSSFLQTNKQTAHAQIARSNKQELSRRSVNTHRNVQYLDKPTNPVIWRQFFFFSFLAFFFCNNTQPSRSPLFFPTFQQCTRWIVSAYNNSRPSNLYEQPSQGRHAIGSRSAACRPRPTPITSSLSDPEGERERKPPEQTQRTGIGASLLLPLTAHRRDLPTSTSQKKMVLTLYNLYGSPPCGAVRMLAQYVGPDLELKNLNMAAGEHLQPEYLKLNPFHKVPTLVDDDFVLYESNAILYYLINKYDPDSTLYPKCPRSRAAVDKVLAAVTSTIQPHYMAFFRPRFYEKKKPTEQEIEQFEENALRGFEHLIGDGKYAVNDTLTLADFSLVAHLTLALELPHFRAEKFPKLVAYYERLKKELESFEEINRPGLEALKKRWEELV